MNPRVDERLDAVIRRMLPLKPEERGTAKELAEVMERGADQERPEIGEPLFEWETLKRTEWPLEDLAAVEELGHRARRRGREVVRVATEADAARRAEAELQQVKVPTQAAPRAERAIRRERSWPELLWLAAVMVAATLVLWPRGERTGNSEKAFAVTQGARDGEKQDGGVTYVGDNALTSSSASMETPADKGFQLEAPPKPVPGQIKPDTKGRCHKGQVALNGGCWFELKLSFRARANLFAHGQGRAVDRAPRVAASGARALW